MSKGLMREWRFETYSVCVCVCVCESVFVWQCKMWTHRIDDTVLQ